jgi:hypothetical protein
MLRSQIKQFNGLCYGGYTHDIVWLLIDDNITSEEFDWESFLANTVNRHSTSLTKLNYL